MLLLHGKCGTPIWRIVTVVMQAVTWVKRLYSLIYKVFNAVHKDYHNNNFNWINRTHFLLNHINFNRIWENPASVRLGNKVKHCLQMYYAEYFEKKIKDPVSASLKIEPKPKILLAINYAPAT